MAKDSPPLSNKSRAENKGAGSTSEALNHVPFRRRLRYRPLRRVQRTQYHIISKHLTKAPAVDPNRFDWILEEFLNNGADHESSGHTSSRTSRQQKQIDVGTDLRVKTGASAENEELEQISRALQHGSLDEVDGSLDEKPEPGTHNHQEHAMQNESLDTATLASQGRGESEKQANASADSKHDLDGIPKDLHQSTVLDDGPSVVLSALPSDKDEMDE